MDTSKTKVLKAGALSVTRPLNSRSVARGRFLNRDCSREAAEKAGCKVVAAQQQFQEEADINFIMRKYEQTGMVSTAKNAAVLASGIDLGFKTFADAHEALTRSREVFLTLPPEVRLELGNDPGRMRELATDDGLKALVGRMGERSRAQLAHAMKLVRSQTVSPPSPAPQSSGEEAPTPGASSSPGKKTPPA